MGGSGNLPVGPGIWGFIAFFVLAVALWFLVRNMNSRLRRMAYRDRDEADQLHTDEGSDERSVDGSDGTDGTDGTDGPGIGDGATGTHTPGTHANDRPGEGGPGGAAPRS
ncbi:hypothetical protein GCM10009817_01100 [Terrabacter lapilli]|uniref:Uncharacterized protein n=1 Tax=Terrabacter lapilli TaxID=436231 RepID=A0ABN2R9B1_9MICO